MNPRWVTRRRRKQVTRVAALYRDGRAAPLVAPVAGPATEHIVEVIVDSGAEESVAPPGLFEEEVVPPHVS